MPSRRDRVMNDIVDSVDDVIKQSLMLLFVGVLSLLGVIYYLYTLVSDTFQHPLECCQTTNTATETDVNIDDTYCKGNCKHDAFSS